VARSKPSGGMIRALPPLGDIFWAVAGDTFTLGFEFSETIVQRFSAGGKLAHLRLAPNPPDNPKGDFGLASTRLGATRGVQPALSHAEVQYIYSTIHLFPIGLFRRELFAPPYCDIAAGNPHGIKAKLAPILRAAMDDAQVTAELYTGALTDVGTPERLAEPNKGWPTNN
jgi:MurNAc alpha-1-phosphate uridylyltransferase